MNKMGSAFDNSSFNHKQQEPIILFLSSYRRIEYSKYRQFACKNVIEMDDSYHISHPDCSHKGMFSIGGALHGRIKEWQ